MADKKPSLQDAADLAEKYGDTKTQANVKMMQYPDSYSKSGYWKGTMEPLLMPKSAQEQMEKTSAKSKGKTQEKADPDAYKKGGKVKKTGIALVHKGERVLTKKQQNRIGGNLGGKAKGKSKGKSKRKYVSGKR